MQLLDRWEQLQLLLVSTNREEDIFLGKDNSGRNQCFDIRLIFVLAETCDLSRRCHLNTEHWIRTRQPAEAELGDLHSNIIRW